MEKFTLYATPWWVNLSILVPIATYYWFRKEKLRLGKKQLLIAAIFGAVFGFVEASIVIYLRAATGLLSAPPDSYQQIQVLTNLTKPLFTIEFFREAATIIMLMSVAALFGSRFKEKFAIFLWTFAFWDIFYYFWLWLVIGWPTSLATSDVLFLIPIPWLAEVWFPILISGLSILAVWLRS